MGALVRRKGWQTDLFAQVTEKYRAAVAVLLLTGARPAELAQGVVVHVIGDSLEITVSGAKLGAMRGQPVRTLLVTRDSPHAEYLAMIAGDNKVSVSADAKRLCDAVRKAGKLAFPRMHGTVSPYSLRHAVASGLKAAGIDPDGIAQVLGHQATRSQQTYGLACHGRQETAILGVRASVPVRDTGRSPVSGLNVQAIAYDRWRIELLRKELERIGSDLPLVEYGQGFKDMAPALDHLEAELLNGRIRHGNHPVLSMCAANAVITKDPTGARKLDKSHATGRIDGLQAMAMAFGIAAHANDLPASSGEVFFV